MSAVYVQTMYEVSVTGLEYDMDTDEHSEVTTWYTGRDHDNMVRSGRRKGAKPVSPCEMVEVVNQLLATWWLDHTRVNISPWTM